MATELGADVPFFLTGGTALVEGLGERVAPLPPIVHPGHWSIVKPPVGVSTAWAYGALDALPGRAPGAGDGGLAGRATAPSPMTLRLSLGRIPEVDAPGELFGRAGARHGNAAAAVWQWVGAVLPRRRRWSGRVAGDAAAA